jgi:prepilin-type N-terminal cleavage/methylation domain-containing protein
MTRSSTPPIRRPRQDRPRLGFTLVELMVVIVILAFLIALLLPALNSSIRTARNTAVGAEINQMAQALESFKSKYGDYPPSRILLIENGDYHLAIANVNPLNGHENDITVAQLAQRSLSYLRKFFPRVVLSTSGTVPTTTNRWYDFNGNGTIDNAYILDGHECLVFFLGGIPTPNGDSFSMSGFGKDPTNPFSNNLSASANYSANRTAPLFEFNNARLFPDTSTRYASTLNLAPSQVPGYLDSLGNAPPDFTPLAPINFYAYFSAYGNNGYDPNDVSFGSEVDANQQAAGLYFKVGFPVTYLPSSLKFCFSFAPNPYTSTVTVPATGVVAFQKPQSFQIISSGVDGLYGVAGQYTPDAGTSLPLDASNSGADYYNSTDNALRIRENDNLTNFHNGKLQ